MPVVVDGLHCIWPSPLMGSYFYANRAPVPPVPVVVARAAAAIDQSAEPASHPGLADSTGGPLVDPESGDVPGRDSAGAAVDGGSSREK